MGEKIFLAGPDLMDVLSAVHLVKRNIAYMPKIVKKIDPKDDYDYECKRCHNYCYFKVELVDNLFSNIRFVPMFSPRPGYYAALSDVEDLGFIRRNTVLGFLGKLGCIALRDARLLLYALSSKDIYMHFHVPPGCVSAILNSSSENSGGKSWLGVDQLGFSVSNMRVSGLKPHVKANAWRLIRLAVAKKIDITGIINESFRGERDTLTSVLDFIEKLRSAVGSFREAAQAYLDSGMLEPVGDQSSQSMALFRAKPPESTDYAVLSPLAGLLAKNYGKPVAIFTQGLDSYLTIAVPGREGATACGLARRARDLGLVKIILSDCGKTVFEGMVKFLDDPENLAEVPAEGAASASRAGGDGG